MLKTEDSCRFFVQNSSDEGLEFVNRQKSVFEKLDAVVKENETIIQAQSMSKRKSFQEECKPNKKQRYNTRQFQGQESIFKRPEAPPPSRFVRNIPAYVKNPEKWTKYTLSDVSQEDMSDRSNTAAAMSFLRELRAKKECEDMDVDGRDLQVTFKKPSLYTKQRESEMNRTAAVESPSFKSSKVLMPEYVVGEKKMLKRKIELIKSTLKQDKTKPTTEIKLDHLLEEDEF